MTKVLLSVALILTPHPVSAPLIEVMDVPRSIPLPPISAARVWTDDVLSLTVLDGSPAPNMWPVQGEGDASIEASTAVGPSAVGPFDDPPPSRPEPAPPLRDYGGDVRGRGLSRLVELGAVQWQLDVFDCLAWAESGWQSKRSNQMNSNGTYDHGAWQINDVHKPRLWAMGLDPYVVEQAADYVWFLSGGGFNFGPWSTRYKCGV